MSETRSCRAVRGRTCRRGACGSPGPWTTSRSRTSWSTSCPSRRSRSRTTSASTRRRRTTRPRWWQRSEVRAVSVVADIPCSSGFPLIQCPSVVGWITVAMAFVIFVGSIYLILAAVFGVRMGYLVVATAFFGWMMIFSSLWAFGFWSQGLGTPTNLGPRGTEPHWQPVAVGVEVTSSKYPVASKYPGAPWQMPKGEGQLASVGTFTSAVQEYMANQANAQLASQGKPATVETTDFAYHDSGNIPIFSFAFLGVSIIGFLIHLPFLDRAERRRKAVLTGGRAPEWRGPA